MPSREYTDRALRSFFGAREGGQDREQTVNTPPCVLRAIAQVWPEGIELDPCHGGASVVDARRTIIEPAWPDYREDGRFVEWPHFTYANPPYKTLKEWLVKPAFGFEHMMLIPVRPNRTWWVRHVKRSTRVCWLKPLKFLGHKQAFPAPLCVPYYGTRIEAFDEAFQSLGEMGCFL